MNIFYYLCEKYTTMRIAKDDLLKQKEMMTDYIGKQIPYNGQIFELKNFCEYTVQNKFHIECVLCRNDKCITVPITDIFVICYPYVDLQ